MEASEQPSTSSGAREAPRFIPNTRAKTYWRVRLTNVLFRGSPLKKVGFVLVSWIAAWNAGIWYFYGPDHPLNNFMWRIRKSQGTLPKELLEKERVVDHYFYSRFTEPSEGPPRYQEGVRSVFV
ncbi:unnamed protein product, partial [Mesorhabditis spiculigera]